MIPSFFLTYLTRLDQNPILGKEKIKEHPIVWSEKDSFFELHNPNRQKRLICFEFNVSHLKKLELRNGFIDVHGFNEHFLKTVFLHSAVNDQISSNRIFKIDFDV